MLPILQIGPLAVQTPGLALLAGVWIGLSVAERQAHRHGVSASDLYNLAFIGLIAGIVGARLIYVLRFWNAFAASPASILSINPGLLDPVGGLLAGGLAALVYGQGKRMAPWPTLDALTPALAVVMLAAGVARLASGAGYGTPTNLPWGLEMWGASRHPTQLYEILTSAAILIFLWPNRRRMLPTQPGSRFLVFLVLQATAWIVIEAFRADSVLLVSGLRAAQVLAWILLAASLGVLNRRMGAMAPRRTNTKGT